MIIRDEYTVEQLKLYLPAEFQPQLVVPCELNPDEIILFASHASDEIAEGIANSLKTGVEHSAGENPDLALELGGTIIAIGKARHNGSFVGLGMMAQGDTMMHSGRYPEGWDKLCEAGQAYLEAKDEFGWARTCVGRLWISSELGASYVEMAVADAQQAEKIFLKAERYDRLFRLYHSWGIAYLYTGNFEDSIKYYLSAIEASKKPSGLQTSRILVAQLHSDIGYAYNNLGQLHDAMDYLTEARRMLLEAHNPYMAAMAEFGMAKNHVMRGQYRQALHLLLNHVLVHLKGHRADSAKFTVVECYLALNRPQDAYELAQEILSVTRKDPKRLYQTASGALLLATIQTQLGRLAEAQESLELAETSFADFENMVARVQLRRGQVALAQGDLETAHATALTMAEKFQMWQQPINWMEATQLGIDAALLTNDLSTAYDLGKQILRRAREIDLLPARYRGFRVLGEVLEKQGKHHASIRMYQASLSALQRIQRSLTISLRPGFLEDKLLPFRRLMQAYLTGEQVKEAFGTLEQLKSQVFQDYLTRGKLLRWTENDQTRPLLYKLSILRDKYHWLLRLQASPQVEQVWAMSWYRDLHSYDNLQQAIMDSEKQMRQLTEQLYLFSEVEPFANKPGIGLGEIQSRLDADTLLLEFYVDREHIWCFGITREGITATELPVTTPVLQQLVEDKWRSNLDFALQFGPNDPRTAGLTAKAKVIGEKLYQMLIEPVAEHLKGKKRLVIVPYGFLHQLPFNILRQDKRYLIDTYEIVVLPSASLLCRIQPHRDGRALIAAHSWDGRLKFSLAEGLMVQNMMQGTLLLEGEAVRELLQRSPQKVLHISAHGEHRIDQPDLAYIELADGPVYTDDLLQGDLSYELVILSACETGRAQVTAGDELIGLGRGFLYAGAGALMTSLWRVNEQHTYWLMESLYRALSHGASKAAALQTAQRELLVRDANLHPAFWAAFQLIGNADALTSH